MNVFWLLAAILILPFAWWVGGINGLTAVGVVCTLVYLGSCVRRAS